MSQHKRYVHILYDQGKLLFIHVTHHIACESYGFTIESYVITWNPCDYTRNLSKYPCNSYTNDHVKPMRHCVKHIKNAINQASLGTVQKHKLICLFTDFVTMR